MDTVQKKYDVCVTQGKKENLRSEGIKIKVMLSQATSFPEKSHSEQKALLILFAVTARGISMAKLALAVSLP